MSISKGFFYIKQTNQPTNKQTNKAIRIHTKKALDSRRWWAM